MSTTISRNTESRSRVRLIPAGEIPAEAHRVAPMRSRFIVETPFGEQHVVVNGKLYMAWADRQIRHWAVGTLEIRNEDSAAAPIRTAAGSFEIAFS